jgi:hypothetical protein
MEGRRPPWKRGRRAFEKTVSIAVLVSVESPFENETLLMPTLKDLLYCSRMLVLALRSEMILSLASICCWRVFIFLFCSRGRFSRDSILEGRDSRSVSLAMMTSCCSSVP